MERQSLKKQIFYGCAGIFHRVLKVAYGKKYFRKEVPFLSKILLCNQGTYGDVFLSTFLIPGLKAIYPNCQIGVLLSPEMQEAAVGCPGVDKVHFLHHWLQPGDSNGKKIVKFLKFHLFQKKKLIQKLREEKYQCAINLYPFFSDVVSLFLKAKIPFRFGFKSKGYRELFSHRIPWKSGDYLLQHYKRMLHAVTGKSAYFYSPWISREKVGRPENYVIFHIGSRDPKKDLPVCFWKALYERFKVEGYPVYFTGKGETQRTFINQITPNADENLCDQLHWKELLPFLFHSQLVLSVDTVIVHLAAAMRKPFFVFYQNTPDPDLWRPDATNSWAFIKKDPTLYPLVQRKDENLIWVENFKPEEVFEKAKQTLREKAVLMT